MNDEDRFYEDYLNSIYQEFFNSSSRECFNKFLQDLSGSNLVLYVLYFVKERQTVSSLSKLIHVSIPRVTMILDSLEEKGLVERVRDENDRRIVYAVLTKKGKGDMDDEHAQKRKKAIELLKKIGKDDLLAVRRAIDIVQKENNKEEKPC